MTDTINVPPQPLLATCPQCGMERGLPREWQELMLEPLAGNPEELERWDGQLRCRNGHEPVVMNIRERRMSGLPFPVVSLEVQGMKMSIRKGLDEYVLGLSEEIRQAVDQACSPENVKAVIAREASSALDVIIREEVERFYRHGPGRARVREAVEKKLRDPE